MTISPEIVALLDEVRALEIRVTQFVGQALIVSSREKVAASRFALSQTMPVLRRSHQ